MYQVYNDEYLMHHGIKGQRWGIRRYQYSDGSLTTAGRRRYYKYQNSDGSLNKAGIKKLAKRKKAIAKLEKKIAKGNRDPKLKRIIYNLENTNLNEKSYYEISKRRKKIAVGTAIAASVLGTTLAAGAYGVHLAAAPYAYITGSLFGGVSGTKEGVQKAGNAAIKACLNRGRLISGAILGGGALASAGSLGAAAYKNSQSRTEYKIDRY